MKQDDLDIVALVERSLSSTTPGPDATVDPSVAAVVTVESDTRFLPRTLEAVFGQTTLPGFVVVADCAPGASAAPRRASWGGVTIWVVGVRRARSFGDAVSIALDATPVPAAVTRLWLLHDDSRPADDACLERLLEASRNSPGAGVVGAKHLDWELSGLQDVGYMLDASHRRASLVVDGEPDQEQYDDRQEVYGVSLAGALVSRPVWIGLTGSEPWFTTYGESMDFCRRVYRSGGRVMVCPKAVVAHARARFQGIRGKAGEARDAREVRIPHVARRRAADRFLLTDVSALTWLPRWAGRIVMAVVWFVMGLAGKRPYEAVCDLISPFTMLFDMPMAVRVGARSRSMGSLPRSQRAALTASRRAVAQWQARTDAFAQQGTVRLLSSLERTHLRRMLLRRALWALALTVAAVALSAVMNRSVLRAALTGATLYSDTLVPTAASWGQVWHAATAMYTYADGFGTVAPPAPFMLVLAVLSALTGGHVAQAVSMFLLAAPALAALAFWALAGVATRSNPLRFALSAAWVALAAAFGLYQHANVPMLMVHVFLPLSIALLMKAVGMHRVDPPDVPHPSVQLAALASITLVPVTASEPQLSIPFVLVFVAFLVMVRSHRAMLLLMPLPSVMVLGPTLFHVVKHARQGAWRQLFGDVSVPMAAVSGRPSADAPLAVAARALGLSGGMDALSWAVLAVVILAAALALAALARPTALRMSRMMWTVMFSGVLVGILAPRVAVGVDSGVPVAGSALPGMTLLAMGMLVSIGLAAGSAMTVFDPLTGPAGSPRARRGRERTVSGRSPLPGRIVRAVLSVCVLAGAAVVAAPAAIGWQDGYRVGVVTGSLPMAASDYLSADSSRRIVAVRASSGTAVRYAVMRTAAGDLIDVAPSVEALRAEGALGSGEADLMRACAQLLSSNSDDAIDQLTKLGIGGIWIPDAADETQRTLLSHVTASDGTQIVVDNETGAYVRLVSDTAQGAGIDVSGEDTALADPLRKAWVASAIAVFAAYALVALPRRRAMARIMPRKERP